MRRRLTPQEKKVLSYQRDCRNSDGENDKSSRMNIPRSKARGERSYRSRVKQALRSADAESADVVASELHRDDFGKSPDAPLAEHVEREWRHRGSPRLAGSELREEAKRRLRKGRAPNL